MSHLIAHWGKPAVEAQDLTQGFFLRALEGGFLHDYDPTRVRFRSYVRACLDHFVLHHERDAHRQKRGGHAPHLSLDFAAVERGAASSVAGVRGPGEPPASGETPDEIFQRAWRQQLLLAALADLGAFAKARGKEVPFQVFQRYLFGGQTYQTLANELGIKPTDVTNHLHAMRSRFQRLVLTRLRAATADEDELREEARALLGVEP